MPHVSHRGLTCISVPGTEDLSCHSEGEYRLCFGYSRTADWTGEQKLIFLNNYLSFGVFTRTYLELTIFSIYTKKKRKNKGNSF